MRTEARSQFIGFRGEEELNRKLEKRKKKLKEVKKRPTGGAISENIEASLKRLKRRVAGISKRRKTVE